MEDGYPEPLKGLTDSSSTAMLLLLSFQSFALCFLNVLLLFPPVPPSNWASGFSSCCIITISFVIPSTHRDVVSFLFVYNEIIGFLSGPMKTKKHTKTLVNEMGRRHCVVLLYNLLTRDSLLINPHVF